MLNRSLFAVFRGLTLRGCEDIDDAAVIMLSKYTAAQQMLPETLDALDIRASDGAVSELAAANTIPTVPSYRNVSLQRSVLSNSLVGLRLSEAPSNPHSHLHPVLSADESEQSHGTSSAQRQQGQHLHSGDAHALTHYPASFTTCTEVCLWAHSVNFAGPELAPASLYLP